MTGVLVPIAAAVARGWTRLYTAGLPPLFRDARRREIACDLFESARDAAACGEPPSRTALHMLTRTFLGAVDDLTWRFEHMSVPRHFHAFELGISVIVVVIVVAASFMYELMRADTLPTPPRPAAMIAKPPPPPPPPPQAPPRPGGQR